MKKLFLILVTCLPLFGLSQTNWQWANEISSNLEEKVLDVHTELASGTTYSCGYFDGDLSSIYPIGLNGTPDMSIPKGVRDAFVAKYDANGVVQWGFKIGGVGATVEAEAITIGPSGNIYVTGEFFGGNIEFQGVTTSILLSLSPTAATKDMFLAAYNSNGELLWATKSTDTGNSAGLGITADVNGIYVAGKFAGDITFPPLAPLIWSGVSVYSDAFVTKFDFAGNAVWAKTIFATTGDGHINAFDVATDGTDVFAIGTAGASSWTFGPTGFNPTDNNYGFAGTDDVWVVSLNENNSNLNWSQVIGSVEDDEAKGLGIDALGLYMAGGLGGSSINFPGIAPVASIGTAKDIFSAKLFSGTGLTDWVFLEQNASATDASATDISIDALGNLYITGSYLGTTQFNGGLNSEASLGGTDVFVMSRKNTGVFNWVLTGGSVSNDEGLGISHDNAENVYIGGHYDLGGTFGSLSLNTNGLENGFVNKISTCSLSIVCPPNQTATANGLCQYSLLDYTALATPFASCGIASVKQIPIAGTTVGLGTNPVTVYLTDNNGNVDSCLFNVLVEANVNPTVVSCGDWLQNETTIGQTNTTNNFGCVGFPTPGEDVYYQISVPAGNYWLQFNLDSVVDANDAWVETFWVGGSCPLGGGCLNSDWYDVATQQFSGGGNSVQYLAVGPGTYYFVVDAQNDGIDSYNLGFYCLDSGIEFDESASCGDPNNDGIIPYVDGSTVLTTAPCQAVNICHDIFVANPNDFEWIDSVYMDLGDCYSNVVPTAVSGFYEPGNWLGTYDTPSNSISWQFNNTSVATFGDGYGGNYSCDFGSTHLYTLCFTADISPTCAADSNLNISIVITDDAIGSGGGTVPGIDQIWSNDFTVNNPTPTITCPTNVSTNAAAGTCSAQVNSIAPIINDNCPGPFTTYTLTGATNGTGNGDASGNSFNVGITTVQYIVSDSLGAQDSCSFTITINDAENPTISCPANVNANNDPGLCTAIINGIAPTGVGDNCGIDSVNYVLTGATTGSGLNDASGLTFNIGTTTVSYTATDTSGNTSTCNFTITINETQNPTISCVGNVNSTTAIGGCTRVINGIAPTAFGDNCVIDSLSYTLTGATLGSGLNDASGTTFNLGVTTVTYTIYDAAGNSASCNFTVTISDNQSPTMSCPFSVNVNNDPGVCTAVVNGISPTGIGDNCSVDSVSYVLSGATTGAGLNDASGATFNLGVTTVIYTIYDAAGNSSSCNFTVTVSDNEPPTFTCPINTNEYVDLNCDFSIPDYTSNIIGLTDNCTSNGLIVVTQSPTIGTVISGNGTSQNITLYASDVVGNIDSCSFTITLIDTIKPTITCLGDTTEIVGNNCSFTLPNYTPFSVSDNCAANAAIIVTQTPVSGTIIFSDTLITLTADDGNGNTDTCSFMVFLSDTTSPTLICPNDTLISNDIGDCSANATLNQPISSDNCIINSLINDYNNSGNASDVYPVGVTTVTWTLTDNSTNSSTCTFNVTVVDAEKPSIICISDTTINTDINSCDAVFNYNITASDNCIFNINQIAGLPSGSTFPQGTTTNTFVASDTSGLADTCSFIVTVIDNQNPTITCPNDTILCNNNVVISLPIVADNCMVATVINDFNSSNNASGIYPTGITTVNWTVSDTSSNISTCIMTVEVEALPTTANAGNDQFVLINQNTHFEANHPIIGIGNWSTTASNGVVDDVLNPLSLVSNLNIGDNIFRWTISNGTCPDSFDEVNIIVGGLNVPSGFSPNGDSNNDLFVVPGLETFSNEVIIFNRWGVELYKTNNYQNDWNGVSNEGKELPEDTYFYVIKLNEFNEEYSGYIVIKR